MANFTDIEYRGGHPKMPVTGKVTVIVDEIDKYVKFQRLVGWGKYETIRIGSDEIINISLDEKSKRSAAKVATGAIIGGVLTGGIGLLAGGLLGGRRKDISNIYVTIAPNGREIDIILKAGKQAEKLYAALATIL